MWSDKNKMNNWNISHNHGDIQISNTYLNSFDKDIFALSQKRGQVAGFPSNDANTFPDLLILVYKWIKPVFRPISAIFQMIFIEKY